MRAVRTGIVALLIVGLATSSFAGDLQQSIARAAQQQPQEERAPERTSKPLVWTGTALFVGGMTVGLFAFINNQNGKFSEFGEANAVNKKLGAAALSTAFVGGALIFMGNHRGARRSPQVIVGPNQVTVSKRLSW
jgi:hypothetical protein